MPPASRNNFSFDKEFYEALARVIASVLLKPHLVRPYAN